MKAENPYKECEKCKTLEDCPHPDVQSEVGMSLPMPPDCCPKPIDVMKATLKKREKYKR
jgi:hypothetical protein